MRPAPLLALICLVGCDDAGGDDPVADAAPVTPDSAADLSVTPDAATADGGQADVLPDEAPDGAPPGNGYQQLADAPTGPIWGYSVATVGPAEAWLFGGTSADAGGGDALDTTWHLTAEGLAAVDDVGPGPRYCGCAAWDPTRGRAVVVGGKDHGDLFAETWSFEPGVGYANVTADPHPSAPVGCAIAYAPERDAFYVFGGSTGMDVTDVMWRLDAETLTYTQLDAIDPEARYDAILRDVGDGRLLLLGGGASARGPFYGDAWFFDVQAEVWQRALVTGDGPGGRRVPWVTLEAGGTALYGFGVTGFTPGDAHGDLCRLDLATATWTNLQLEGPSARGFSRWLPAGPDAVGLVVGGFDNRTPYADVWKLRLE